ncbi:MAG TPA: PA14 domain-containing protein, partial [Sedimentisphaerales bacterium]
RTYAPNNLILVAGAFYSQVIGPAAAYPLTGDNIVIVSHIYSGHWLDSYWVPSYKAQINTALTRYPVFMSEWGFSQSAWGSSDGTITSYGQPLADFREARKISNSAWVASYDWGPPMFWTDWTLRIGEGEMGGFTKDTLYLRRNDDQPSVVTSGDATGFILREWWTGISGTSVSSLTSDINYPTNPNGRTLIAMLEGPTNWTDSYGTRIRGYLYPPADGNYTFWIASDANSQLWLSTDADPCHAVQIAYISSGSTNSREWTKYTSQTSTPKSLLAGHKYYIEALQKESTSNDNIAVAWEGPGITQQVIDGMYLSPYLYNFKDYAIIAPQWLKTNCSRSNAWCNGADRDRDGNVGLDDLMNFAQWWLLETY